MELPATTRINTLRIRGPADARHRITRRLNEADWPEPADQSWVLVRELRARGPLNALPDALLSEARHWAREGGDESNVVRFASLDELLCALLRDLALGVSDRHWYWRNWRHLWPLPRGTAIAQLLSENSLRVNAVCARLAARQALGLVWQYLDQQNAVQVLRTLARETGLRLEQTGRPETPLLPILPDLPLPPSVSGRWLPLVVKLSARDTRHRLTTVLIALECAPMALAQAPEITLGQIRRQLTRTAIPGIQAGARPRQDLAKRGTEPAPGRPTQAPEFPTPGALPIAPPPHSRTVSPEPHRMGTVPSASPDNESGPARQLPPPAAGEQERAATQAPVFPDSPRHPLQRVRVEHASTGVVPPAPDPVFDKIHTEFGGTLYLLNFLNREAARHIMADHWARLPSGWAWLYQLARELAFDSADPLADFLALQMGLASPRELETLAPLPQRQALLQLAGQWYGRDELWQPSLLRMPAELHYTPSHIDLHASERAIRLDVRLAGLDINPGWLPWLGRVVTFHYGKPLS